MNSNLRRQIIIVSRYAILGIFLQCYLYSFTRAHVGLAQNKSVDKIEVHLQTNTASLKEIFEEITAQIGFEFHYVEQSINLSRELKVFKKKSTVGGLLRLISGQYNLSFQRIDHEILVKPGRSDKTSIEEVYVGLTSITISGRVTDDTGQGLPGVAVVEKGTSNGTVTDIDGNYQITADENGSLIFSFVGLKSQEIVIDNRTSIDVVLLYDVAQLEEVVVIGYGTQSKKDVTGSIASVESAQLSARPITSVEDAMQGLVPGLNIAQRATSPGELGTVSIRGLGSITAGTAPLWVVDGFPTDQRNAQAINPADIKSVEILKDASATAIYGSRGANGVILITTKSGREGQSNIEVSITSGIASVPNSARMEVLSAEEYVQFHTEQNGGTVPDFIADNWDGQTDTDWQDLIFRNASFQNYAVSASGGSEKVNYLLSANYIDQEGTVTGEFQKKYSFRAKVDYRPSDRFTIGLNIAPNVTTLGRSSPGSDDSDWASLYAQSLLLAPILPVNRENGTFSMNSDLGGSTLPVGNPLETAQNWDHDETLFRLLGGLNVSVEVIQGLNLKSTFSANIANDRFETIYQPTVGQNVPIGLSAVSSYNTGQSQQIGWLNENTINYRKALGDHAFDVLGGFTLQRDKTVSINGGVDVLQIPGIRNVNIGDQDTRSVSTGSVENTLVSYLGRLNYSFKERYLLTGTVRTDGSSVFGSNNRYQTFGSFALGWRFSEEVFLQGFSPLNSGKLRLSFGTTGSNSIPPFASRATLSTVNHSFGGETVFGTSLANPGNNNLTWETSEQLNAGLDLTMFENRLNLTVDYFNNKTTSLLLTKNIVPSSGYSTFLTNIGSMRNKGFEITIDARVLDKGDWQWSVGGNITMNDQEILDLGGDEEILNFFGALKRVVGEPLQQIVGPKVVGVAREGDDQTGQPLQTPGAPIYEDVDGDGSISNFLGPDGQLLGDTNVDLIYGINTNVRYKNWRLSALLNGQSGAYVYDFFLIQIGAPFRRTNISKEFFFDGRYISEAQPGDGKTPAANGYDVAIATVSSLGVQKTDYLRIRNITLSYDVPNAVLEKFGMSRARIYTSIENVHTFTDFVGGNPEARRASAGGPALIGGSQIASVTDGRELGLNSPPGLPLPRTWILGINVTF